MLVLLACAAEALSVGRSISPRIVPLTHLLRLRGGGAGGEGKRERGGRGEGDGGNIESSGKRARGGAAVAGSHNGASEKHWSLFQRLVGQEGGGDAKSANAVLAEMEEAYSTKMLKDWETYVDEALEPLEQREGALPRHSFPRLIQVTQSWFPPRQTLILHPSPAPQESHISMQSTSR